MTYSDTKIVRNLNGLHDYRQMLFQKKIQETILTFDNKDDNI